MDAFLLVGQSNMAGRGRLNDVQTRHKRSDSAPSGSTTKQHSHCSSPSFRTIINGHEILSFDESNKWIPAKHPLHYDKPSKCGIGPGLAFAKLIAQLDVVDTNRKIGLIPCAIGGTSIQQWLPKHIKLVEKDGVFQEVESTHTPHDEKEKPQEPTSSDGIFENVIRKTLCALHTKFESHSKSKLLNGNTTQTEEDELDIELKGILWHQGESDCGKLENAKLYLPASMVLFENFRKHLHDDNIPIIVGGLADFLGQNKSNEFVYYNTINTALQTLPTRLHNVAFVSSHNLNHIGDWLHLDGESCEILGHRYAAKYAKLSGSLSHEELDKYMRFNAFSSVLRRQTSKAYEKTKGVSFKQWCALCAVVAVTIYAYKQYYDPNSKTHSHLKAPK